MSSPGPHLRDPCARAARHRRRGWNECALPSLPLSPPPRPHKSTHGRSSLILNFSRLVGRRRMTTRTHSFYSTPPPISFPVSSTANSTSRSPHRVRPFCPPPDHTFDHESLTIDEVLGVAAERVELEALRHDLRAELRVRRYSDAVAHGLRFDARTFDSGTATHGRV